MDLVAELTKWWSFYKTSPELQLAGNFLVGATGALVTVWFRLRHERHERSAWDSQKFFYVHEFLTHPRYFEARRHVRTKMHENTGKFANLSKWIDQDFEHADIVCATYDQAWLLLKSGAFLNDGHRREFLETWGKSICSQYEALQPYIERDSFFDGFSRLYEEARAHRKATAPKGLRDQ